MFKSVTATDLPSNAPQSPPASSVVNNNSSNNNNNSTSSATRVPAATNNDLNIQQRVVLKEQRLEDIKNQCSALISELDTNQDPEAIVKKHISQLKKYNELKDIALGLVTMIADQRQLRTTDILEEMKVELADE
ncbi:unnamed protein product [Debaryomyces tyrocola]|nr:unnamed protein product [Debaryomyces tyrocola]